jgi:hypothetical protein
MHSRLQEARKQAGLAIQIVAIFPTLLLVTMGMGSGNSDVSAFFAPLKSTEDYLFIGGLVGVPVVGALIGHFVKLGHRWAYALAGLAAALAIFFPIGAPLGLMLLFMIGRVCVYELR